MVDINQVRYLHLHTKGQLIAGNTGFQFISVAAPGKVVLIELLEEVQRFLLMRFAFIDPNP